jgi:hypothetical protein
MWRDDTVGKSILDELARAIEERNIQVTIEKDAFGSLVFQLQKIMSFGRDG